MKHLLVFGTLFLALTSCCFSQLPTQYAYLDDSCNAVLPDFTGMVVAYDNCDVPIINQYPPPGDTILVTTVVEISATDAVGNSRSMSFDVVLLDTIAPTIQMDTTWTGYSDREVGDMYRTFYGWVQLKNEQFVDTYEWDTLQYSALVLDGIRTQERTTYINTIVYPDEVRKDWWWGTNYPE